VAESLVVQTVSGWLSSAKRKFVGIFRRIAFLVENPCDVDFAGMVQFGGPATGNAVMLLLVPSWGEVLENYLEPKSRRGIGRRLGRIVGRSQATRSGGRRRSWPGGLPDVDEMIAAIIPARAFFASRIPSLPEAFVWLGINVVDRLLWYWLLIEVVDQATYAWSSSIMRSEYCMSQWTVSYSGRLKAGGTGGNQNVRPPNIDPLAGRLIAWLDQSLEITAQGQHQMYGLWTVIVANSDIVAHDVGLTVGILGEEEASDFQPATIQPGGIVTLSGFLSSPKGRTWTWDMQKDSPFVTLAGGNLAVFGKPSQ